VRRHDDLRAGRVHGGDDGLDIARGGGVETCRRLVQKQHFGLQRPGAGKCQALLLADRENPGLQLGEIRQTRALKRGPATLLALVARNRGQSKGVVDVGDGRGPQHHRALKDHRLTGMRAVAAVIGAALPDDAPFLGHDKSVQKAQQQALSGAVRAQDDAERPAVERQADVFYQSSF
jgi:hypothetical protein